MSQAVKGPKVALCSRARMPTDHSAQLGERPWASTSSSAEGARVSSTRAVSRCDMVKTQQISYEW